MSGESHEHICRLESRIVDLECFVKRIEDGIRHISDVYGVVNGRSNRNYNDFGRPKGICSFYFFNFIFQIYFFIFFNFIVLKKYFFCRFQTMVTFTRRRVPFASS